MRATVLRRFFLVVLLVAACGDPAPAPSDGPALTDAALRQTLVDAFGPLWFCDPDFYPVARGDEIDAARERWPEVVADADAFAVTTTALGIAPDGELGDAEKLAVYQAWKRLRAISLEPGEGAGAHRFDYLAEPAAGATDGQQVTGSISASGVITIEQQGPAGEPICPICLAIGTRIETPTGRVPVERLRIGDAVWTLDPSGRRLQATVIATASTAAPAAHEVVRLELADGRTVTASPGHPLADGRRLGDVRPGDPVDGATVRSVQRQPYGGRRTFDIAVSGPTGRYLADGIGLASTLDPDAAVPYPHDTTGFPAPRR